jgi:hypothetical protein
MHEMIRTDITAIKADASGPLGRAASSGSGVGIDASCSTGRQDPITLGLSVVLFFSGCEGGAQPFGHSDPVFANRPGLTVWPGIRGLPTGGKGDGRRKRCEAHSPCP